MGMRSWRLLLAALSIVPAGAGADEASHRAAVEELVRIMQIEELSARSMEQLLQSQLEQVPAMEPYRETLRAFYAEHLGWASLKDDYIALYQSAFDEAELRELSAFYKTPTGQKLLERLPQLIQDGAAIGVRRLQAHMPELQQRLLQRSSELEAGAGAP